MAQGPRGKVRAFLLAFLMATISMSASLPSWEFSTLEEKSAFQTYSTNSTVDLTLGHGITIPTNLVGNASTGTYEFESELKKCISQLILLVLKENLVLATDISV